MDRLKLIKPRSSGLNYESIRYTRISPRAFNVKDLRLLLLQANVKYPNVTEIKGYIIYQYKEYSSLLISKANGLIYGYNDDKHDRISTMRLLRILHKANLVYGFDRFYLKKPKDKLLKGWIEQGT